MYDEGYGIELIAIDTQIKGDPLIPNLNQILIICQCRDTIVLLSEPIDTHECHQSNWFHLLSAC